MGAIKLISDLLGKGTLAEKVLKNTIGSQMSAYDEIEARYKKLAVKYDNNMLLGSVWGVRKSQINHNPDIDGLIFLGILATASISILDKEDAIIALSCILFIQTSPIKTETTEKAQEVYAEKINKLAEYFEDEDLMEKLYKIKNPASNKIIEAKFGSFRKFWKKYQESPEEIFLK